MTAGELRHRITIERNPPMASRPRSASGQLLDNWTVLKTVSAARMPPTFQAQQGEEFTGEGGRFAEMTDVWVIRGRSGVKENDRLKWVSQGVTHLYDILGIADIRGMGHWVQLLCREANASGN